MMEILFADQNLPFVTALVLMMGIAVLEGLGLLLGGGSSDFFESLLSAPNVDIETGGITASSIFGKALGWLYFGRVPILILLVVFLTAFGLLGLVLQEILKTVVGMRLPGLIAVIPVLILTLPTVRILGGWVEKVMPKDETSAVSHNSFIGRVATVVIGTAKQGEPAQAKLLDQFGRTHYVMVEPDIQGEELTAPTAVLLVSLEGSVFRGIRNTTDALVN